MKRHGVKRLFRFPSRSAGDVRADVAEEFQFHLDMRVDALVAQGLTPDAARAQAAQEFGDRHGGATAAVHHQGRIERRRTLARWLDDLRQDLRVAGRSLRRAPGFTCTALIIVALGIGATTALFSVLSAVLLRPLPYPDSGRLVDVWTTGNAQAARDGTATLDYREYRDGNRTFDALGLFSGSALIITGGERAELVNAMSMTAPMWRVFGVSPVLGRAFTEADQEWGRHRVAVISDALWKRRYGGDPGVVGTQFQVGPQSFTVLGVMPASFGALPFEVDMWTPMSFPPSSVMDTRRNRFASMLGRLKPGVTVEQARDDLRAIAARLADEHPEFNARLGVEMVPWQEGIVGGVRSTLILLFGAVVFLLLIACTNLANLLIARATTREQELQTRAALGASGGRLLRQVLTETCVLVAVGGIAGLVLAVRLVQALPALGPIGLPRMNEVAIDGGVMAFAVGVILATTVLFGLWPSRRAAFAGARSRMQAAARTAGGGRSQHRARRTLIVAEVSLSLVLLIGATLLVVSLHRLQQVEAGFDEERLFTAIVSRYRPDGREVFVQRLLDEIAAAPGVRAAAATTSLPLTPGGWSKYFSADDAPVPTSMADVPVVRYHHVTPGYFEAVGARLRRGRTFTPQDRAGQPLVAIVNESLARQTWPGQDPIGKRIAMFQPEALAPHLLPLPNGATTFPRATVVGVVGDFRHEGLDQSPRPGVFVTMSQSQAISGGDALSAFHYVVARTTGDPLAMVATVERATRQHDRNAAVSEVRTMESRLADSMARRRFAMLLLGGFASLAMLLTVVGLYGVMAYSVSQRREELGVRAAVGASAASLMRLVMADGLRLTLVGVVIGLVLAVALSGVIAGQLFDVRALNPWIHAAMTMLMIVVAALACGIPAARAARVDPVTALRAD